MEIKSTDTASEGEIRELERQIGEIAAAYGGGHRCTRPLSAPDPTCWSVWSIPACRVKTTGRSGRCRPDPAWKSGRAARKTADDMRRLSITCSVFRTCRRRSTGITDAVAAAARDPGWNMFSQPATGPPGGRGRNGRHALRDAITYAC